MTTINHKEREVDVEQETQYNPGEDATAFILLISRSGSLVAAPNRAMHLATPSTSD